MFEIFIVIVFIWLLITAIRLAFKLTWGFAKIIASILSVLALPLLVIFLLFAGGAVLMIPVAMIGIAAGILKACV